MAGKKQTNAIVPPNDICDELYDSYKRSDNLSATTHVTDSYIGCDSNNDPAVDLISKHLKLSIPSEAVDGTMQSEKTLPVQTIEYDSTDKLDADTSTVELAKVSRLLLAVDSGKVAKFQGMKLDDVMIDGMSCF